MESQIEKKFKLSRKAKQDLKLWFFIVHPGKPYIRNEAILAIIGYDLETAQIRANSDAKGIPLTYTGQNAIVRDFVNQIYLGDSIIPSIKGPEQIKPVSKEKLSKEQFKVGLTMAMEEFVKSKEDKELLNKVIKGL